MSLIVMGLNHRTAPVEVRERLAFAPATLATHLSHFYRESTCNGLVLLSTCNRTEFYLASDNATATQSKLLQMIQTHAESAAMGSHLYTYTDGHTVQHLFRVASGLDSMVIGEHEILGQVKQAYLASQLAGCTDKLLNVLFQRSLYVGKRVRTETGLSLGSGSVASVAVSMADRIFGDLQHSRVMILGAGAMAELTAKHLLSQKVHSLVVSNRSYERACELAQQFNGTALHYEEALKKMDQVDIVICSTAAPHPVILPDHVREIMHRRMGRSLFFIDIAVPRDVHPDVHKMDNVFVYNLDDLQTIVTENMAKRSQEVERAEAIIKEKSREFTTWLWAQQSGQTHTLKHASPTASKSLNGSDLSERP